nr:ATP-dependent Clp protease proteolytic subunit [Ancylobacter gelatini]
MLRLIFRGLIVSTVLVLGWDLHERMGEAPPAMPDVSPATPGQTQAVPYLPSARPGAAPQEQRRPGATSSSELAKPMTIELVADGRLEATGTITPGTAERFKAEIDRRGDYVKTVVLNSPGGSVSDALAMARLVRERKFATLVESTALCASSCPLIFAGGTRRIAEPGATIGVHQVFGAGLPGTRFVTGAEGMAQAQRVSAECQRHLVGMGVDPRVWIHAMETPPQEMFYFTAPELVELKLATPPATKS